MSWQRPPRPPALREISPASLGVVLVVLLNNSHSYETAIISWERQDEALNRAVRTAVDAFAEHAARKRRARLDPIHSYPSTQAKQRLGDAFVRRKPPGKEMRAWVPTDRRKEAMIIVADEVVVQKKTPWRQAVNGLQAMATVFEQNAEVLRNAGRLHSRAAERRAFLEEMSSLFARAGHGDPNLLATENKQLLTQD